MSPDPDRSDAGSAVVEFVLVSSLLVALFLGVVQLAMALHVRNTLTAAAAEGARVAANADRSPADGAARTRELVSAGLGADLGAEVRAVPDQLGGAPAVLVEVRARVHLFGWAGPTREIVARAHAFEESGR